MRYALIPRGSGSRAKGLMPVIVAVVAIAVAVGAPSAAAKPKPKPTGSFVGPFNTVDTGPSTVPANGDVNPYGVAVSPVDKGSLVKGDVLVSNFNNSIIDGNQQGTGTTIVEVSPSGDVIPFATLDPNTLPGACPGGVGLTTALVALKS